MRKKLQRASEKEERRECKEEEESGRCREKSVVASKWEGGEEKRREENAYVGKNLGVILVVSKHLFIVEVSLFTVSMDSFHGVSNFKPQLL